MPVMSGYGHPLLAISQRRLDELPKEFIADGESIRIGGG